MIDVAAVEALVGATSTGIDRLGGGDVAQSFRVRFDDGSAVFAKTHHDPPPHFFSTEAAGLAWLRDGVDGAALSVPEVIGCSDEPPLLVLSWVDQSGAATADEAAVGRALADLHRSGAPCFGREDRRTTGSRRLPNDPCSSWVEFYAERRLRPLARLAGDTAALPPAAVTAIEDVADRLDQVGGPAEPPARLHGDLWAGNRIVDRDGRSWLIDPAAHGGHREFDLAMMRLFGGFGPACFAAYQEASPLADGWEDRVALHQLAPLIVHAGPKPPNSRIMDRSNSL
ncbi:MAG: fructosamine kinase family protein [Actinomycetota bacterium]